MSDLVTLSIPVSADLLVLVRLTAATVASRAGFDVEEIEDLRLAVDELCISLVNEGGGGRLELEFIRDSGLIEVSCTHQATADDSVVDVVSDLSLEGLSSRILDALVDAHGQDNRGGYERAWLRKQRARQQA